MLYLTSDLHFGHRKVAEIRGFKHPDDHDEKIIDTWSRQITDADHVWVLGDLAASSPDRALSIIADLPGVKHLIAGNHDQCHPLHRDSWKHQRKYLEVFESVQSGARRRVSRNGERTNVLMSHFPYRGDHTEEERYLEWRLQDYGSWIIHGHTHSTKVLQYPRSIHVGWDAWRQLVPWTAVEKIVTGEHYELYQTLDSIFGKPWAKQ